MLGPAVGKGNGVRSLEDTGAIVGLSGVEGSLGVFVGDGVGVGVVGDLIGVNFSGVGGGTVGGGSVGNDVHKSEVDGVGDGVVGHSQIYFIVAEYFYNLEFSTPRVTLFTRIKM